MCLFSDLYYLDGIKDYVIPIYYNLSNFYQKYQKLLLWESVRNQQSKLVNLIAFKNESILEFRKSKGLMNLLNFLTKRHQFESYGYLINQIEVQKISDLIIPTPSIPKFFKEIIIEDLQTVFFELISCNDLRSQIIKILESSDLNQDIFGFRTIDKKNQSVIIGKYDNSFSSFRSLCHELGHCLFEASNEYTSVWGSILSEFFALLLEQSLSEALIMKKNMPLSFKHENAQYCESLLILDRLFYIKEVSELMEIEKETFPIKEELLVFRPSYFTGTGMQIIYGESSFLFSQLRVLAKYSNLAKVLSLFSSLLKIKSQNAHHFRTLKLLEDLSSPS